MQSNSTTQFNAIQFNSIQFSLGSHSFLHTHIYIYIYEGGRLTLSPYLSYLSICVSVCLSLSTSPVQSSPVDALYVCLLSECCHCCQLRIKGRGMST
ncbi:hypothetical protein M758_10G001300 [Ceratodon purpureus]|nr:hypothetical protein M758_10G001300 [Ceratodon purpureus]